MCGVLCCICVISFVVIVVGLCTIEPTSRTQADSSDEISQCFATMLKHAILYASDFVCFLVHGLNKSLQRHRALFFCVCVIVTMLLARKRSKHDELASL